MARTSFSAPEAHIVVSTDGYFDVYPTSARTNGDKPAYRGVVAELGPGIRGTDDRLAVRPGLRRPRRRGDRVVRRQWRGGARAARWAAAATATSRPREATQGHLPGRPDPHQGRARARRRT